MKSSLKKSILFCFALTYFTVCSTSAQDNLYSRNNTESQSTLMSWNKNTPETEMKDDINALKKNGITITYSNLKRNSKGEIVSIKVNYKDSDGNSGSQEYDGKKPISVIKFYKSNDKIGFGEINSNMEFAFNDMNDIQKSFKNRIKIDTISNHHFDFENNLAPRNGKKSKIMIHESGKKPLVIEDGKVVEGGDDYSKEELEKIKDQNKFEFKNEGNNQYLDFNFNSDQLDMNNLKEQIEKMQSQLIQINPNLEKEFKAEKNAKSNNEISKEEFKQAKEEMLKVKKEMEDAKKELQKTKEQLKSHRI